MNQSIPSEEPGSSHDELPIGTSHTDLTGSVDRVVGRNLSGWAADRSNLGRRLVVEVSSGGRLITTSVASEFREDLSGAGIGDGKHAFRCTIPDSCGTGPTLSVTVRVQGTDFHLTHSAERNIQLDFSTFLNYVAADIADNCNLRCPFCLVDYSRVTKTNLMSEETFRALLRLIGSVPDEGFWLSCLHEPTLHPQLNRFLELIPVGARKKVWFTTNLARPLTESTFEGWAQSGIHHINVSVDSMNPDLFATLRRFGRYEVFKRNLDLLARVFRRFTDRPRLRYITMAFKSNLDEIPRIVEYSNEHWLAFENEIRYTYNVSHITDEFRREHYLDRRDWNSLTAALEKLPYRYSVAYPPQDGYEELIQPSANYENCSGSSLRGGEIAFERPLALRARPDGTLLVVGRENQFAVNIHSLPDPVEFFRNL